MLDHVVAAARELDPAELIVVVGHCREQVTRHLAERAPDVRTVVQDRQGGTGHAVRIVLEEVSLGHGTVVVTYGDAPVLRGRTLAALVAEHTTQQAAATALTTVMDDPTGYGRILRDASGSIVEIVEEADATPEQRAIKEVNSGVYAFEASLLADSVKRVPTNNAKGEEYLTDVVAILRAEGHRVASVLDEDAKEVFGVNDRAQLAQEFLKKVNSAWEIFSILQYLGLLEEGKTGAMEIVLTAVDRQRLIHEIQGFREAPLSSPQGRLELKDFGTDDLIPRHALVQEELGLPERHLGTS
jgi:bifunctional N-acetylglucosamine-1-phosphate-uridyltransferase/glucosamine-1-phosphate-acetyltransferase GlmU-like protein